MINLSIGVAKSLRLHMGLVPLFAVGTTTEVASNILTYEKERLLVGFHNQMVGSQFAQKGDNIPQNKGDTVRWHRKIKLARATTAVNENTDITPKAIYMTEVHKAAEEWADGVALTRKAQLTAKHLAGWDQMTDSAATNMAETLDYQMMKLLAQNGYRMRADNDTNFQVDVAATSDGIVTTFISTALTQADTFWAGGYITITMPETTTYLDRANYCETRLIASYVVGTVTCAAFPAITKNGCTAHLCVGTGITATDVLSTSVIGLMVRQLKRNKGVRFNDALITKGVLAHKETQNLPPNSGGPGYWVAILDQDHEYDFMKDVTWLESGTRQDKEALVNGEIKKWLGTKFYGITQPWRETVAGVEAETTGAVHPVNFLASDAYGISPIAAPGAKGDFGVVVTLKTPEDFADYIQLKSSVSWQVYCAWRSLNSLWNVTALCGATA